MSDKKQLKELLSEWRDFYRYPGLQVQANGCAVRNVGKDFMDRIKRPARYYKIQKDDHGRKFIYIKPNGFNEKLYVDVLVATCFCPRTGDYIGHKDGNISNDCRFNLEWVDRNTYRQKYHSNKMIVHNNENFIWWKDDWYISEKGKLLKDGVLYDKYRTSIYDGDLDLERAIWAYVSEGTRLFIEDGVEEVWNKVILHIDGDYGNWDDTNLKSADLQSPEAQDLKMYRKAWLRQENRRFYEEKFHEPMPSCLE